MRTTTCDTHYKNNGYTNVTKVHEGYIEFGTGSNHKKHRKTKMGFPKEYVENAGLYKIMTTQD